jgi:hypothetical protein
MRSVKFRSQRRLGGGSLIRILNLGAFTVGPLFRILTGHQRFIVVSGLRIDVLGPRLFRLILRGLLSVRVRGSRSKGLRHFYAKLSGNIGELPLVI